MHKHRILTLGLMALLAISACQPAASPAPSVAAPTQAAASEAPATEPSAAPSAAVAASPTPRPADMAEAIIPGVEANAEIGLWTYWLSPTFDQYIKDTIARFEATYPGVKVNWEDHQATFPDDLKNAFNAGNAPDVINLSVGEGWVSDYASRGLLLNIDDAVAQEVKDIYFPGLWQSQLVDGKNYQFPWYQSIAVELINKKLYEETGKLSVADFPTTVDGLPAVCEALLKATNTPCAIRLTTNDLLAQMVYEGNVKILSDDGQSFTFDSPEGVAWLQMYVDMATAGSVDKFILTTNEDRVGLNAFSAGAAPFYQTAPNLIRVVKENNATLYEDLAVVPAPVGKSGVVGKGSMGMSVKGDTPFPNASLALAQFFTNPTNMIDFSKVVSIYPSSPSAYDDPFFSSTPELIEDSARPIAKDIVSKYADIVPTVPNKPDVNEIVRKAVESAIVAGTPVQEALSDAVADANKLLD